MANSKYEYVKSFEVEDEIPYPNIIVVRIDGREFLRFSEIHQFVRPNDECALNLISDCAKSVFEEFPDVVFAYGFSDEYSFVFKKETKFYQRRAGKILSLLASFFSSVYVSKWNDFYPRKQLVYPPSFKSRVIRCATMEVLQTYLACRQNECHVRNQYDTCFWKLVQCGRSVEEAEEVLKGTQKQEKNEMLFHLFGLNYKELPQIFRQGSCVVRSEVEYIVKYNDEGVPVKRLRRKGVIVHAESIASRSFWNEHPCLLKELGRFEAEVNRFRPEYIRSFESKSKLMPSTWIVVRIDGCHFHRFSETHEFEKPNDEQALNLMNSCSASVVEEFRDVVFSYGVSDEYSFVLKKNSQIYERRDSDIVSVIVSFFSSVYMMRWRDYFPQKKLKSLPYFDGRAVCYPSEKILRDYLAWRQVDCHVNNQYNTCFWMLVKSGKSKSEAQNFLKGTQAREKNKLLTEEFGIDYDRLPTMFRLGSSVFWDKEEMFVTNGVGGATEKYHLKVVVDHCNIIDSNFWQAHSSILDEANSRDDLTT